MVVNFSGERGQKKKGGGARGGRRGHNTRNLYCVYMQKNSRENFDCQISVYSSIQFSACC